MCVRERAFHITHITIFFFSCDFHRKSSKQILKSNKWSTKFNRMAAQISIGQRAYQVSHSIFFFLLLDMILNVVLCVVPLLLSSRPIERNRDFCRGSVNILNYVTLSPNCLLIHNTDYEIGINLIVTYANSQFQIGRPLICGVWKW